MNGVLELSDPASDRQVLRDDAEELMKIPEEEEGDWDEESYSDSGSDCSCSTCSTCSLCDMCDPEGEGERNDLHSEPWEAEERRGTYPSSNRFIPNGEQELLKAPNNPLKYRHSSGSDKSSSTSRSINSLDRAVENMSIAYTGGYSSENPNLRPGRKPISEGIRTMRQTNITDITRADSFGSEDSGLPNAATNGMDYSHFNGDTKRANRCIMLQADSSGSEREATSSVSGLMKPKPERTDSSSELSSSGYSENGSKEKRKKKKVTFVETSLCGAEGTPEISNSQRLSTSSDNGRLPTKVDARLSTSSDNGRLSIKVDNQPIDGKLSRISDKGRQSIIGHSKRHLLSDSLDIGQSGSRCNGEGYHGYEMPVLKQSWGNGLQNGLTVSNNVSGGHGNGILAEDDIRYISRDNRRIYKHSLNNLRKLKSSSTEQENDLDSEYTRLRHVLNHMDPYKLHAVLRHQLKRKKPEVVSALGILLPRATYTADTVHCVRCHKEYNPQFGKTRCEVPHPPGAIVRLSQDDEGATYGCTVCGHEYRLIGCCDDLLNIEKHSGYCYVGVHTPCPADVRYSPQGPGVPCEDKGCIEFYV